jgi:hypothetical protein
MKFLLLCLVLLLACVSNRAIAQPPPQEPPAIQGTFHLHNRTAPFHAVRTE